VLALSGAKGGGPFPSLDLGLLRQGFDEKFWAHIRCAQAAVASIRKDGSITFVSAVSARRAAPGTAGLAAINAAIEALAPVLAVELKPLRVNAVSPGLIVTPGGSSCPRSRSARFSPTTPPGRVSQPEDVAAAIAFLIADSFICGDVLVCDGGLAG
jgi:NAD(P)-dependent dehydrogenase (short-subunit alcohol dehydrogenase family)